MTAMETTDDFESHWWHMQVSLDVSRRYHDKRYGFFRLVNAFMAVLAVVVGAVTMAGVTSEWPATVNVASTVGLTTIAVLAWMLDFHGTQRHHRSLRNRYATALVDLLNASDRKSPELLAEFRRTRNLLESRETSPLAILFVRCQNEVARSHCLGEKKIGTCQRLFSHFIDVGKVPG